MYYGLFDVKVQKWLKSVHIYSSYRPIKVGGPIFWTTLDYLLCRKFAAVCRKNATSSSQLVLTRQACNQLTNESKKSESHCSAEF